jgi:hypothetical protein
MSVMNFWIIILMERGTCCHNGCSKGFTHFYNAVRKSVNPQISFVSISVIDVYGEFLIHNFNGERNLLL